MPQMRERGKFIFGKSLIRDSGTIQFPEQAIKEYDITSEGKIYLITGSKKTGGFCVTRKGLFAPSKLGRITTRNFWRVVNRIPPFLWPCQMRRSCRSFSV